jgi:hypothetical protein
MTVIAALLPPGGARRCPFSIKLIRMRAVDLRRTNVTETVTNWPAALNLIFFCGGRFNRSSPRPTPERPAAR